MSSSLTAWEPVKRQRTYEQVIARIEERILDGQLHAGDRLPPEREFAQMLGVSRPSLRESLRVLEALGIVEVRLGSEGGTFLSEKPSNGFVNVMKPQLALALFHTENVIQTRLALEAWTCAEAAKRRTPEQIVELGQILDRMEDPEILKADFNRLDAAFHVEISGIAGNHLIAQLMESLRLVIHKSMMERYAHLRDWKRTATRVREEHRSILAAIADGDSDLAAVLVQKHIRSFWLDTSVSEL